ncbi:MAG: hypothetical protein ABTQ93_02905 [Candidatus Competibacter denitrificans]
MGAYLERLKKINLSLSPTDKTDQADKTAMSAESVAHEKVESPLSTTDKTDKSQIEGSFVSSVSSVSFDSSREGEKFLQVAPSTPTPFVGSVSAPLREIVDFSVLETAALAILKELYQQHRQRLADEGRNPQGARVRAALLARAIPLEAAIALRQTKRVKSDGLYWSLVDEVTL